MVRDEGWLAAKSKTLKGKYNEGIRNAKLLNS